MIRWKGDTRLAGLRRFALALTTLNVVGYAWLGFESTPAHALVALLTAYAVELLLETIGAWAERRPPAYAAGLVDFLLPAHISGLAVSMLLFPHERYLPIVFAAAVAIGSKSIVRGTVRGQRRHVYNPSNLGISLTLLLFPWVGITPPYMFTAELGPIGDWALPGLILVSGTYLNARYTGRLPLLLAWLGGFVAQAVVRAVFFEARLEAALLPMTGMAFLLFSLYMVTDPATTPAGRRAQAVFGAGTAIAYGVLMCCHVVFGLFFALAIVSTLRGAFLLVRDDI